MSLGCALRLLLGSIILFVAGCSMVESGRKEQYEARLYRQPVAVTCAAYSRQPPKAGLYKVTGGRWDLLSAVFVVIRSRHAAESDRSGPVTKAFIPVRAVPDEFADKSAVRLVVVTHDDKMLGTIRELKDMDAEGGAASEARVSEYVRKNVDQLFPQRDVVGVARFGEELDSDQREALEKMGCDTAKVTLIEDGFIPSVSNGASSIAGGSAVMVVVALFWMGWVALLLNGKAEGRHESEDLYGSPSFTPPPFSPSQTYTVRDARGVSSSGVTVAKLRVMVEEEQITRETLVRNEATGVILPVKSVFLAVSGVGKEDGR